MSLRPDGGYRPGADSDRLAAMVRGFSTECFAFHSATLFSVHPVGVRRDQSDGSIRSLMLSAHEDRYARNEEHPKI